MKKCIYAGLFFLAACGTARHSSNVPAPALTERIASVTKQYAPDPRTVLFKVVANGSVLSGETNNAEAKKALLQQLDREGLSYTDSIVVLPLASPDNKTKAVVSNSVANLRLQPRHQAELTTQATLGTPLIVLKRGRGWYLVQTPDHYLAWVDGGAITSMDDAQFGNWQAAQKIIYKKPYGFAYSSASVQSPTVSDLVFGDILEISSSNADFYEVKYPDGRNAFVPFNEAIVYKDWVHTRTPVADSLVATAKNLLGLPYLWGGTSFKGVDCSGFTRTVYFMNGLILPRDASQQAAIGELVDTKNDWKQMRAGDLLFFGTPARDTAPARVVHVGMWIGNDEFIHSSGRVKISSMNPAAANYDENERRRFLFARHISSKDAAVDLREQAVFQKSE